MSTKSTPVTDVKCAPPDEKLPRWHNAPTICSMPISNTTGLQEKILSGQPVIIRGSQIIHPALAWTPEYLNEHMAPAATFTVYCSQTKNFRFWDLAKNTGRYRFNAPTEQARMTFQEFYALTHGGASKSAPAPKGEGAPKSAPKGEGGQASKSASSAHNGGGSETADAHQVWLDTVDADDQDAPEAGSDTESPQHPNPRDAKAAPRNSSRPNVEEKSAPGVASGHEAIRKPGDLGNYTWLDINPDGGLKYYLQYKLTEAVGKLITADYLAFDWEELLKIKPDNWGPLTTNLLLVGQNGNVTPAHYDEQENFFAQLHGRKRVILFPPDDVWNMYPYPIGHACDRQSMIDFDRVNYGRFPRFANAHPQQYLMEPGDMLFIPSYWWHHIISESDTVSVNFWFKSTPSSAQPVEFPLRPPQVLSLMRNIEKLMGSAVGPENVDEAVHYLTRDYDKDWKAEDIVCSGPGPKDMPVPVRPTPPAKGKKGKKGKTCPNETPVVIHSSPPMPMPENFKKLQAEVNELLLHVMKPGEIGRFLCGLADGRYGIIPKETSPPSATARQLA